jgi:hypothetical protein
MGHNIPEVQAWIKRIVDSCQNDCHFDGAQIIIDQFKDICDQDAQWAEAQHYLDVKYGKAYGVFINNELISLDDIKQYSVY